MKKFYSFMFLCLIATIQLQAQSQLLSENFNSGLPASWIQSPATSWTLNTSLGQSGNGCIFTQNSGSATDSSTIYTPTLNLTGVTSLTVTFKAAIVGNNFLPPNVVLSYDAGMGKQLMARWGTGFSPNTTDTITYNNYGYDYQPPLDAQAVHWCNLSHTLSAVNGTVARFVFDAEMYNGGYVVLDSVVIKGQSIATGVREAGEEKTLLIFPNPADNKQIHIIGGNITHVALINSLGEKLPVSYALLPGSANIDLGKIPAGVYYLEVYTDETTRSLQKIVVE